jgi:hypothetical protein
MMGLALQALKEAKEREAAVARLSRIEPRAIGLICSNNLERDRADSLRNLRKLDCAGKPAPSFLILGLALKVRTHLAS